MTTTAPNCRPGKGQGPFSTSAQISSPSPVQAAMASGERSTPSPAGPGPVASACGDPAPQARLSSAVAWGWNQMRPSRTQAEELPCRAWGFAIELIAACAYHQAIEAKKCLKSKTRPPLSATITMKSGTVYIANTARQATMVANSPARAATGGGWAVGM